MEVGGVPGIGWEQRAEGILESEPPLRTAGCSMRLVRLSPRTKYVLEGASFTVCLLRGTVTGANAPQLLKSFLIRGQVSLQSGDQGCLLFVSEDVDGDFALLEDITGLQVSWSQYDSDMYRTVPQVCVDGYRINLWYLGPDKCGGIHNHNDEPVPFVEFHSQLRGGGWMVKYEDKEGTKEIERVPMPIGYTHDLFCSMEGGKPVYPWHEYIAGHDGTLFVVFEDTAT